MPDTRTDQLAILITSYNIPHLLAQTLDSVSQLREQGAQLLVMDAGSDTATPRLCKARAVSYVRQPNSGYASLVNAGIARCERRFVLLLNGDAQLIDGASVERALEYLDRHRGVGALGLRHVDGDGHWQLSCWPLRPNLATELIRKIAHHTVFGRRHSSALVDRLLSRPMQMRWVAGSAILAPRTSFAVTKGWDERYFLYFEDIDWCLRLQRIGKRTVYFPHVTVRHIGGASTGDMAARKELIYRTSQRTMFDTYCGAASIQGLVWYQRLLGLISST
jgi:N-acetylglucosaminyl-diphospho-decaprenol L-rhamnosyltransferase